ncbi:MAG: protein jag [Firmicutes bacterium]|jgi:spoIIIJ-associated protein|nr:protein jag [Bacillota bacterium]
MKSVEKRGKTVEEAVNLALQELGVGRDAVSIEVLEEGAKGLFGLLGSRGARVRVTVKPEKGTFVKGLLGDVARALGITLFSRVTETDEYIFVEVTGSEAGMLIGRHGQALDSLQYLINVAAQRVCDDKRRVVVDIEGYRKRREEVLRRVAERAAEKVKRTGKPVVLDPMPPHERRIVHLALQKDETVETHSEGEEPYRRIVITSRR